MGNPDEAKEWERRQRSAPLYEALVRHAVRQAVRFHVPGHKGGSAGYEADAGRFFAGILKLDLTEIEGLDDLHAPQGVIREAERLAAELFQAGRTFFLVGGSTVGNLAMILSVCREPGDIILVNRDAHKSVIHALMMAQARAVFLAPRICGQSGLSRGVAPQTVRKALMHYPQAKAVFLTSPSYYGMCTHLKEIAEIVHEFGIPLLVDEAHGAHFGFHPALPMPAIQAGADAAVQSAHKMLTAMTMGAMLHLRGERVPQPVVSRWLAMLQSSSPSYPIMASLDLCRQSLAVSGREAIDRALREADRVKREIGRLERWGHVEADDPFKLILYDRKRQATGYQLQRLLNEHGCFPELADLKYTVLAFSAGTRTEHADRLIAVLRETDRGIPGLRQDFADRFTNIDGYRLFVTDMSEPVAFSASESMDSSGRTVPLEQAAGMRSAELVIPYPPGIPLLYPGERIHTAHVDYLRAILACGARIEGTADPSLRFIRVLNQAGTGKD